MASLTATSLRPAERRALERLAELLEHELGAGGLETIWLYGSRARGEPGHEDSDVDVLVIARDVPRIEDDVRRLVAEAAGGEGRLSWRFSVSVKSPEWLQERREVGDFYVAEVERDGVVLYGSPEAPEPPHEPLRRADGVKRRSAEKLAKGRDQLVGARAALSGGSAGVAVSAAYYAMFYAARAMLSEEDLFARTHDGTWQLVRETLALTGRFPIALVRAAQAAQALRVATDYEDAWPSLDRASEALAVAERFVDEATALIGRPRS